MKCLSLRKHIKSLNFFLAILYKFRANAFILNNILFGFIKLQIIKSNITISFLPDELIIACSLAHIDHSICRILISVDLLDEGKPHDHGRRKMIQNDSQQHRKTSKPRNNSYKKKNLTYIRIYSTIHSVVITY